MKRWLSLILALLLFTGCAAQADDPAPTAEPTGFTETTAPATEPAPSMLEISTSGSLQILPLETTGVTGIAPMGDDLAVFSGGETTTLTVLSGETLEQTAQVTLHCTITPEDASVYVGENGVVYYDETNRELVWLNAALAETHRTALPESITGSPILSADRQYVYYCSADSLRYIDLNTGLDKLLKEISYESQEATGLHCNGSILACSIVNKGESMTLFLSVKTGETLYLAEGDVELATMGETYLAIHREGAYVELILQDEDGNPQLLDCGEEFNSATLIPGAGSILLTHSNGRDNLSRLDCYDPVTGKKTASLTLPGTEPVRPVAHSNDALVWFLRYDSTYEYDILCRWDTSMNAVEEDTVYFARRFTAEQPDLDGLTRCADKAAALSETYGVEIHIWNDIEAYQTNEFPLIAEYQVPLIESSLTQLEAALSRYPEGFLTGAASATDSGVLQIMLARYVAEEALDAQYWTDDSACIALCADGHLEQDFHHQLFYIVENRVLGKCTTYDNWSSLNPKGFSYTLDMEAAEALDDTSLLEGKDRAFIDLRSMSFPREDRAAIMEYAMMEGNEAYFESDTMQQKLNKLCVGIRKAFGLKDYEGSLLWEQYLNEPVKIKK